MAPVKLLNKTYKAFAGTNKSNLMPMTKSLSHEGAALTRGYRGSGATRVPAKGFRQDELVGRTTKSANPNMGGAPAGQRINSHESRIELGANRFNQNPTTGAFNRPEARTSYGRSQAPKSASGGFGGGPTTPVGPHGPGGGPMPPKRGPGGFGGGDPVPMGARYGPAHTIPEHANPNGPHSVMSEVGRGGRLWGSSMHNFEQAGGMARLGTSAVRGAVVGGISGGLFEGATGGDFWEGAKSGAMYGGVGAGARRGVRSLSGAKHGEGTFAAANRHMKSQYPEGWSKAALAMVKQKNGDQLVKSTNGLQ